MSTIDNGIQDVIASLHAKNRLPQVEQMILDAMIMHSQVKADFTDIVNDEEVFFFRLFDVLDDLELLDNPVKANKKLKFGRSSRYNKVDYLLEQGFLKVVERQSISPVILEPLGSARIKFYELTTPAKLPSVVEEKERNSHNTAAYRHQLDQDQRALRTDATRYFVSESELESMGSHLLLSKFLGRAISPSSNFQEQSIKTVFKVPSKSEEEERSTLSVTTTSLSTEKLLESEDMLLIEYTYQKIKQFVHANKNHLEAPLKNLFTLDLVDIIKDHDKQDSGALREIYFNMYNRISGNEFEIQASVGAKHILEAVGLVNENGDIFDMSKISLLKIVGGVNDSDSGELTSKRKTPRHISFAIPQFVLEQLNKYINGSKHSLPTFDRDKNLLKIPDAGYIWVLNNYLLSMLTAPLQKHGPMDSITFINNFLPALKQIEHEQLDSFQMNQKLLHVLSNKERMLFNLDWNMSTRRLIKFKTLISVVDQFIVIVQSDRDIKARVRSHNYKISFIRMSQKLIDIAQKQKYLILDKPDELHNIAFFESVLRESTRS